MKRSPLRPRRRGRPVPSAAERRHYGIIAALPCVVCGAQPVHVHHVREAEDGTTVGAGRKAHYLDTIPLCPRHHQDGGFGVAFHAGPRAWVAKYGTQRSLLEALRRWFDDQMAPFPRAEGEP